MDKQDNNLNSYSHGVTMYERKNLVISGVKKIDNFNNIQFILETIMGYMIIKGTELELVKLDTLQGMVTIKGSINSINYADDKDKKNKEESLLTRLFR